MLLYCLCLLSLNYEDTENSWCTWKVTYPSHEEMCPLCNTQSQTYSHFPPPQIISGNCQLVFSATGDLGGPQMAVTCFIIWVKNGWKNTLFFLHRHYLLYKWKRLPLFIDVGAHLSVNHYSHCFVLMNLLRMTDSQVPLGVNGKQMFPGSKSVTCCECVNLNKCVCVCVCLLGIQSFVIKWRSSVVCAVMLLLSLFQKRNAFGSQR